MFQLKMKSLMDQDETQSSDYQPGSPVTNSSPVSWLKFSSFVDQCSSSQTMNHAPPGFGSSIFSSTRSNHSLPEPNFNQYRGALSSGLTLERHFGFLPESLETSFMNNVGYRGMGLGHNDGNYLLNVGGSVNNTAISLLRNMTDNGSSNFRMRSSPTLGPLFLGNGPYPGLLPMVMETLADHRWTENNGSQDDSKKEFHLDLYKIQSREDKRTTLMIKNIPNKYTSQMLLATIDEYHKGTYDFLYLPIDFRKKCNMGYAFINMLSPLHIIPFYETFNGRKWEKFNSQKSAYLAYARIQGKTALVSHFQNSSLMKEDKYYHPIVYHSDCSEKPDQVIQENLSSNSNNVIIQAVKSSEQMEE